MPGFWKVGGSLTAHTQLCLTASCRTSSHALETSHHLTHLLTHVLLLYSLLLYSLQQHVQSYMSSRQHLTDTLAAQAAISSDLS